jgi:hypothetical protein
VQHAQNAAMTEQEELAGIEQWFASRGVGFRCWRDGAGAIWADLTRPESGSVVAPRYGRGATSIDAARLLSTQHAGPRTGTPSSKVSLRASPLEAFRS